MQILIIINGAPYGTEAPFNGLRLARELVQREDVDVRVFLMGDSVGSGVAGQKLPDGYYHLDRMLRVVARKGAEIASCGTCMDARAISEEQLVEGVSRGSMAQLADWTLQADRTVTF